MGRISDRKTTILEAFTLRRVVASLQRRIAAGSTWFREGKALWLWLAVAVAVLYVSLHLPFPAMNDRVRWGGIIFELLGIFFRKLGY